ncbi:mucin-2-like [Lineus longissimus]|uniref:mucin-2-like n=1 Tax=Lineus longissimus TaxID=88925 RepID=UPI00315D575F
MKLITSFAKICVYFGIVCVTCCLICSQAENLEDDSNMNSGVSYQDLQRTNQGSNFGDIVLKVIQNLRQNQTFYSLLRLKGLNSKPAQQLLRQSEVLRQYGSLREYDSDRSRRLRRSVEDDSLQKLGEKNVASADFLGKDTKLAKGEGSGTETGSMSEMLAEQEPESQIPTPSDMGQTTSPIKYNTESGAKDLNVDKAGGEVEVKSELVKTTSVPGFGTVTSDSQRGSAKQDNPTLMISTTPANVYSTPTAATRGQQLGPKTTSEQTTIAPKIEKTEIKKSDANFDKNAKEDIRKYNYTNSGTVLSGPTSVTVTQLDSEVGTTVVIHENRPGTDVNRPTMTTVKAEERMPTEGSGDPVSMDSNMKTESLELTTPTSVETPVQSESTDILATIPNTPKAVTKSTVPTGTNPVQTTTPPIVIFDAIMNPTDTSPTAAAATSSPSAAVPTAVTKTGELSLVTKTTPLSNSTDVQSTEHTMTKPAVKEIVVRTDPPDTTEIVELVQPRATDQTLPKETTTAVITKTIPEDGPILANSSNVIHPTKTGPGISIVATKSASEKLNEEPKRTVRTTSDIRTRTIALSEIVTDSNFFQSLNYIHITTSVSSQSPTFGIISTSNPSRTSRTIGFTATSSVSPIAVKSLMPSKTGGATVTEHLNSVIKSSQSGYTAPTMTQLLESSLKDLDSIVPTTPGTQTLSYSETPTIRATEEESPAVHVSPVQTSKVVETSRVVPSRRLSTITSPTPFGMTTPSGSSLSTTAWVPDIEATRLFVTSSSRSLSDFETMPTPILTSSSGSDGSMTLGITDATPSVTSRSQTPPFIIFDGTVIETAHFKIKSSRLEPSNTLTPTASSEIFAESLFLQLTPSHQETLTSTLSNSANIVSRLLTTSTESPILLTKTLSPSFTIPAISPSTTVIIDPQTTDSSFYQSTESSRTLIIPTSHSASEPLLTPIFSQSVTASSEIINTYAEPLVPSTPIFTNYLSQTTANLETSSSSVLKSVISATPSFSASDIETTPLTSQMAGTSFKSSSTIQGTMLDISPTRTMSPSSGVIRSSVQSVSPTLSQTVTVSPTVLLPTESSGTSTEPSTASVTVLPPTESSGTSTEPSTASVTVPPPTESSGTSIEPSTASVTVLPPTESSGTSTEPSTASVTVLPPTESSGTSIEPSTASVTVLLPTESSGTSTEPSTASVTVPPPTESTGTSNEPSTASVTVVTPAVTNSTTSSPSTSESLLSKSTTKTSTTVSPPSSATETTESLTTESSTTVVPPSSSAKTTQTPPPRSSNTVPGGKTTKVTTQNTVTVIVNTTDISKPRNETLAKASMSTTTIVGIAVGSIMGFWIILGPIVCFLCRMKDKAKDRRNRPYDVDDPEEGDFFLRDYVATHLARSRPTNFQNQQSDRYSMDVFTHIENGVMKTEL